MDKKRFILTKAFKISDSEYVPFWELTWSDSEMYGEGFSHGDSCRTSYTDLVDCYWDTLNHKLVLGIVKDVYPEKLPFTIEEDIYIEEDHSTFAEDTIVDIKYDSYKSSVATVKRMSDCNDLRYYFNEKEQSALNLNDIYEIRNWEPTYILASGKEIKWEHQLKHKFKEIKNGNI